jgi:hypothetical protein
VEQTDETKTLMARLAAPFEISKVGWKPQSVKGNRAMALAYIDARDVQDRLDEVLGVENWQDEYQLLPDNSVMCKLKLKVGKKWIQKMDVGSPSEQPDGGDRLKAAFSDALKRAAVKFGIGRYLYRLEATWCDYDPAKRCFTQTPKLPPWALPKLETNTPTPPPKKVEQPQAQPQPTEARPNLPADGKALHQRLREYDAKLASDGRCTLGALLAKVVETGVKAGYGADMTSWSGAAIVLAVDVTKQFEAGLKMLPPKNGDDYIPPEDPKAAEVRNRTERVLTALRSIDKAWIDPKVKARMSTIISRTIMPDEPISNLTEGEARQIINACEITRKERDEKKAAKAAQQPAGTTA